MEFCFSTSFLFRNVTEDDYFLCFFIPQKYIPQKNVQIIYNFPSMRVCNCWEYCNYGWVRFNSFYTSCLYTFHLIFKLPFWTGKTLNDLFSGNSSEHWLAVLRWAALRLKTLNLLFCLSQNINPDFCLDRFTRAQGWNLQDSREHKATQHMSLLVCIPCNIWAYNCQNKSVGGEFSKKRY